MDHRHMADQHLLADQRGMALGFARLGRIAVHDAAVLDVATRADADAVHIAPDHAVIPAARPRPDLDIADKARPGRNEGGGFDAWCLAAERKDRHPFHSRLSISYMIVGLWFGKRGS